MRRSDIRGGVRRLARGQAGVRRGSDTRRGVRHPGTGAGVRRGVSQPAWGSDIRRGGQTSGVGPGSRRRVRRPARARQPAEGQTPGTGSGGGQASNAGVRHPGTGSDIRCGVRQPTWGQAQREPFACLPFVRLRAPWWLNYPAHAAGSDIPRGQTPGMGSDTPARGQTPGVGPGSRRGVRHPARGQAAGAGVRHLAWGQTSSTAGVRHPAGGQTPRHGVRQSVWGQTSRRRVRHPGTGSGSGMRGSGTARAVCLFSLRAPLWFFIFIRIYGSSLDQETLTFD
jgi:hypothetical protein